MARWAVRGHATRRNATKERDIMDELVDRARAVLATTPERWGRLAASVPLELLGRPPAPGEWSALDCLRHLLETERQVFPVRVEALLAGRDFAAFDPDAQGSRAPAGDPAAMAAEFAGLRVRSVALLAGLKDTDLARTARHAELGPVTMRELLNEWVGHDLMHTVQAERALMQPFLAASGPWRGYFADHDVEAPGRR
jgi:hypothetical protein